MVSRIARAATAAGHKASMWRAAGGLVGLGLGDLCSCEGLLGCCTLLAFIAC